MVFSSFEPEDLRVEQTSSVGIGTCAGTSGVAKYGVATARGGLGRPGQGRPAPGRHGRGAPGAGLDVATAVGLSEFQIDLTVAP